MVEDDDDDVRLIKKSLIADPLPTLSVHRVEDGIEALNFLSKTPPYAAAPWPNLVLLDLNMPRMDGREVLRKIKQTEGLESIPVVILTTSNNEADIAISYQYHASGYITKSNDLKDFRAQLTSLKNYWLKTVHLPAHGHTSPTPPRSI